VPSGDERITRVLLNTLDNTSGSADTPTGCYSNYTAMTTSLDPGSSYTLFIYYTNSYGSSDVGGAWIDWNSNQTFDTGDAIALTRVADSPPYFTANVTVPSNAVAGTTRLRVKVQYQGTATACGNASYGEVEDYGIVITASTVGACCTGTSCSTTNSAGCTGSNHYQGNGTSCSPNPCAGACCFPGNPNCTVSDAASCAGGTFNGAGTTCSPSNPCGGACCANNVCTVQLAANCAAYFVPSGVCSPDPCQYCTATSGNCLVSSQSELIGRVNLNTIDNSTGNVNGPAGCFNDFTGLSTDLYRGNTYTLTFTNPAPTSSDLAGAWIDWDQNRTFTGTAEQLTLVSPDGKATWTSTFTVPNTALVGQTRMRLRVQFGGTLSSCGNTSFGEIEDYSINVLAATTGACCGGGGSCSITDPGSCSGAFQGLAVACAPSNPCGGACCGSDGSCSTAVTSPGCPGGSVFFNHVACTPMPCAGVCCDNTSGACFTTTTGPAGCTCGQGWQGNASSCNPAPCGQGACCLETTGVCSLSSLIGCTANSAHFVSVGSVCSPTPCPATGACCDRFSGACSTSTDVQNCTAGRAFLGAGTSCTTNPCGGSCCNTATGACTTPPSAAACTALGGTSFTANGACSPLPCVGACCNVSTGACTTMTSSGCTVGTTIFRGLGSTCTATTCAGACCNIATRACTLVAATTGCGSNITFMGLASTCPAGNVCSGACCDTITRACTMSLAGACPAGSAMTGTTCSPDTCPAGTCCNVVGTCSAKTASGCTGTAFYQAATTCVTTVCSGACCDIAFGSCTVTSGSTTCLSSSGSVLATSIWYGPGTTCTGGTCGVGACCQSNGACSTAIDSASCVGVGTFMGMGTSCPAGVLCYGETQVTDNNDSSAASNAGAGPLDMAPGDQIAGASSGQNTSGGGLGTLDYWQIHPVGSDRNPLPTGFIYKHTLTLNSTGNGGGGNIPALTQRIAAVGTFQFDNHFSSETTTVSDAVSGTGNPPFALHQIGWYGFGGATGTIKVRVLGPSNPVSMYTFTLTTVVVTTATNPALATPMIDGGFQQGGLMTFSTVGETTTDTDMWIFDSNLNPIPGWGSDDVANPIDHSVLQSEVKKDVLTSGFYYIALTDYNLHTSELTPLGDRFQSKQAYGPTYPGIVSGMNVSNSPAPMDVSFKIIDGLGNTHHYTATKLNSYDVVWTKIFVNGPATGACCKPDGTCTIDSTGGCTGLTGGMYVGDNITCAAASPNCAQPPTGACCQADGSCLVSNQFACQTYPGAYRGNNSTCAVAACTRSIDLATSSNSGFAGSGAMFMDVTAPATNGLTITRFDYYASQAYNNVTFYPVMDVFVHPSGSYVGHEFGFCLFDTPTDWFFNTQVRTNPYPVGGSDAAIPVVLSTPVTIPAGQTVGFYLVARQSGIQASTLPAANSFTFSNADISVFSHEGKSLNSGNPTNPGWSANLSATNQSLRGRVYYTLVLGGVCCRGSTCTTGVTQANCLPSGTAGAAFVPSSNTCNAGGNISFPCCYADYNKSGNVSVQDIFDFLNSWFAGSPFANFATDGSSNALNVQNIFDFLNAWFAGGC
jgi:hypothetical protein